MALNSIRVNFEVFWPSESVLVAPYSPETGPITKQRSLKFIKAKNRKSTISLFIDKHSVQPHVTISMDKHSCMDLHSCTDQPSCMGLNACTVTLHWVL